MSIQQGNINQKMSALTQSLHTKNSSLEELKKPTNASLNKTSGDLTGNIMCDLIGSAIGLPPGIMEVFELLEHVRDNKKPKITPPKVAHEAAALKADTPTAVDKVNENNKDLGEKLTLTNMSLTDSSAGNVNAENCVQDLATSQKANVQQKLEAKKIEEAIGVETNEKSARYAKIKNS